MISWIVAIISIVGTFLNIKKNSLGFVFWGVSNIFWVAIDFKNKLYGQAIVFFVNLILCIIGIFQWKKKKN